ncbi:hypothetical protein ACIBG4_40695 [Nonomuraea sp. NPDC050383]|uniref:hypothetical protein n=1 Tax=Nonomuraea sp. NPDC050383 TaxID=3364362 RepID=UPI003795E246
MASPTLPVVLQVGTTPAAQIGTVEIPIVTGPASKDPSGHWQVEVQVDQDELWRRIASLLRDAADLIEKGATDG